MSRLLPAQRLRALALESGFDLCGFARAKPIPREVLRDWLQAGMAADMGWMETSASERLDVCRLLPKVETVCALAVNYYPADPLLARSPVSKYAVGRDYHATLRDRLRTFRRRLAAEFPTVDTYGCVDDGPFMEKVWAARAGLGYVARNGCFVTEEFGSYVVLAALALDARVDSYASGPVADRCGDCTLCISACPTRALPGDQRVDSRRCLSYLTIENEGEVPEELRSGFDGLVFGCDVCQDVCPLNASPVNAGGRFLPRAVAYLGVREFAELSPERYGELVRGTALARAGYGLLRRNAAYALGASQDAAGRRALTVLEGDPDERVRGAAKWALLQPAARLVGGG